MLIKLGYKKAKFYFAEVYKMATDLYNNCSMMSLTTYKYNSDGTPRITSHMLIELGV